jgi:hypothetical protein
MALTPEVRASGLDAQVVSASDSADVQAAEFSLTTIFNVPSDEVNSSGLDVIYVTGNTLDNNVEVSFLDVVAIVRGKIDDPSVRAWTFTLDGHDFYVLRLGDTETLVFDVSTEQWHVWGSGIRNNWLVSRGANWVGGNKFMPTYGSNVVVGSDLNGSLYFLDPEYDRDDSVFTGNDPTPFRREITVQIPLRGYDRASVYEMQLLGSQGDLDDPDLRDIELRYSDDRGRTFVSAGVVSIPDQDFDARATWRSLGSFQAPGRVVTIRDTGALRRIDSITMNSDIEV